MQNTSFLQYAQFKKSLMDNQPEFTEFIGINDEAGKIAFELQLPSNLPSSSFIMDIISRSDEHYYLKFIEQFMKQSKGLFNKYLAIHATVPAQNFDDYVRNEILAMYKDYDEYCRSMSIVCTKQDVMEKCFNLLLQFERAAFLISFQLNRRFSVFCKLRQLEIAQGRSRNKNIKRSRSVSPERLNKTGSVSRSSSRSKSRSRSRSRASSCSRAYTQPILIGIHEN